MTESWQVETQIEGDAYTVLADEFASEADAREFMEAFGRHRPTATDGMRVSPYDTATETTK